MKTAETCHHNSYYQTIYKDILNLVKSHGMTDKIIGYHKVWGDLSIGFLMAKFKINETLSRQIQEILRKATTSVCPKNDDGQVRDHL
jgi:hypothetical protein